MLTPKHSSFRTEFSHYACLISNKMQTVLGRPIIVQYRCIKSDCQERMILYLYLGVAFYFTLFWTRCSCFRTIFSTENTCVPPLPGPSQSISLSFYLVSNSQNKIYDTRNTSAGTRLTGIHLNYGSLKLKRE